MKCFLHLTLKRDLLKVVWISDLAIKFYPIFLEYAWTYLI